jgi:starch synthase
MISKSSFNFIEKFEDIFTPAITASPKRKILIVGPEVTPYVNVGGVSRVLAFLASALNRMGHDARVFMPKFGSIEEKVYPMSLICEGLKVPTDNPDKPELICNVKTRISDNGTRVYFLENREYYELRSNVYGYSDDPIRWALLSRGALEFIRTSSDWRPDVIHVNDWQTGTLPNYLETCYKNDEVFRKISTLFTIHNLSYQGMFDHRMISDLDSDDGKSPLMDLFSERILKQNFMRRGIMYADIVNTVSPNYAREIMRPEFGEGLDRLLNEVRSKVFGILNGIDYDEYNPQADKLIDANYDQYTLDRRLANKISLQREFDLVEDPSIPVIGYVGRLEGYKGLDLIMEIIPPLMRDFNVQFVFVGGGSGEIAGRVLEMQREYPNRIGAHLLWDSNLPRLLFSGADIITVPSRFEPCGLPQMEGMRYGAIPLVHATGGLLDSVKDYNPDTDEGYGFVFRNYDTWSLFAQIVRALETYRSKDTWRKIQKRAMQVDNSWDARASLYVELYEKAIQIKKRKLKTV